jgi:hypothetical protein
MRSTTFSTTFSASARAHRGSRLLDESLDDVVVLVLVGGELGASGCSLEPSR